VKQDNRVGSVDWLNRRLRVDYEQDGAKCAWGSGVRCVEFGVITKLQVHRKGLVVTIGAKNRGQKMIGRSDNSAKG